MEGLDHRRANNVLAELQSRAITVEKTIGGLKRLISSAFEISSTIEDLKRRITEEGRERLKPTSQDTGDGEGRQQRHELKVPRKITSLAELDDLISRLQSLRDDASSGEIEIEIREASDGV